MDANQKGQLVIERLGYRNCSFKSLVTLSSVGDGTNNSTRLDKLPNIIDIGNYFLDYVLAQDLHRLEKRVVASYPRVITNKEHH